MTAETSLTLVRRIKAPPAKIFDAWTRPEQMVQWWGPDAGPTLIAQADLRVGGRYRVRFRMLNGDERECSGVYREIEPERRLVFTWQWAHETERESLVTVALRPIAEGTELTFTHARFYDAPGDGTHRDGWNGALDKLEAFALRPAGETP